MYGQAKIAFRRLKAYLPKEQFKPNEQDLTITLTSNGAVIWFKSADKPDSLYGEDVWGCVIDEASRCKEDAWYAVRSTITATRAPCRGIGNVKGRKNWFYKQSRKAQQGNKGHAWYRITATDAVEANVLAKEEIEGAEGDLPAAVFKELYGAEASDDQGNPFGYDAIKKCVGKLSSKKPVCWGWDLAKSSDWTVGIALDEDGNVCRYLRFQLPWEDTIEKIATNTGSCPALIDSTGVGDPIVERLQKRPGGKYEGYHFSSQSKQRLMEGLAVAIQKNEVTYPAGQIEDELELFEYVYTRSGVRYSAPEGFHDDCVCSLALAVMAMSHKPKSFKVSKEALRRAAIVPVIRPRMNI